MSQLKHSLGAPAKVAGPYDPSLEDQQPFRKKPLPTLRSEREATVAAFRDRPMKSIRRTGTAPVLEGAASLPANEQDINMLRRSEEAQMPVAHPAGPRQRLINVSGLLSASPSLLTRASPLFLAQHFAMPPEDSAQNTHSVQGLISPLQNSSRQVMLLLLTCCREMLKTSRADIFIGKNLLSAFFTNITLALREAFLQ